MEKAREKVDKDAFILAHYRIDMSTREIAAHLGMAKGGIISRYHTLQGNKTGGKAHEYNPTGEGNYRRRRRNGRFRYEQ